MYILSLKSTIKDSIHNLIRQCLSWFDIALTVMIYKFNSPFPGLSVCMAYP